MSRITAPVGEVTTPMVRGRKGRRRLRSRLNSPSAASDHDLIFGPTGIGGELAGSDHLHPVLRLEGEPLRPALPHHPVEHGIVVLERQIEMARGRALEARNLAAQANMAEAILHRALEQARQFADTERRRVVPRPFLG
jgi:hypothetical protein